VNTIDFFETISRLHTGLNIKHVFKGALTLISYFDYKRRKNCSRYVLVPFLNFLLLKSCTRILPETSIPRSS